MGIQAIKGVEIGDGFEVARSRGSTAHDEIVPGDHGIARASHHSGGTEGGMSTGTRRAVLRPSARRSTLRRAKPLLLTTSVRTCAQYRQPA